MSSSDELHNRQELVKLGTMLNDTFVGVAEEALRSVKFGSEITGSAGQPVDTGNLRNSFQLILTPDAATIGTNVVYAEAIEDAVGAHGPLTLHSEVGGFHAIKSTVAGMGRILESVKNRVVAGEHFTSEQTGFDGEDGG